MDKIQYTIESDGTVSITTDAISGTNHLSADKILKRLFDMMGGEVNVRKRNKLEVSHSLLNSEAYQNHMADGHTHQ